MPAPMSASRRSAWLESPPRPPVPLVMMTKSGLSAMMASKFTAEKSPTVATSGLWMVAAGRLERIIGDAHKRAPGQLPGVREAAHAGHHALGVVHGDLVARIVGEGDRAGRRCFRCGSLGSGGLGRLLLLGRICPPEPHSPVARNRPTPEQAPRWQRTVQTSSKQNPFYTKTHRFAQGSQRGCDRCLIWPRLWAKRPSCRAEPKTRGQDQVPVGTAASGRSFGNSRMNVELLAVGAVVVLG